MSMRRLAISIAFVLTVSIHCQFKKEGLASPSTNGLPSFASDAAPDTPQPIEHTDAPASPTSDAREVDVGGATIIADGGATTGGSGGAPSATGGVGGSRATGGATSGAIDSGRQPEPDAATGPDVATTPDLMPAGPIDSPKDQRPQQEDRPNSGPVDAGWRLLWADEFDATTVSGVDPDKWTYVTWNPRHVNGEIQKYTSRLDNVFQDGEGHLVLRALNSPYEGFPYTSGRVETNGKFSFKFGRVEVRAKLPSGAGSFPGIVLLGITGNWPQCGELALMEQYGHEKRTVLSTVFSGGTAAGDVGPTKFVFDDATTASADFHLYSLEWYTDHVVFFVDDTEVLRSAFSTSSPLFNVPEYIVLNVALGGDQGGAVRQNDFPMEMIVDYVRVYSPQSTSLRDGNP